MHKPRRHTWDMPAEQVREVTMPGGHNAGRSQCREVTMPGGQGLIYGEWDIVWRELDGRLSSIECERRTVEGAALLQPHELRTCVSGLSDGLSTVVVLGLT